MSFRASGLVWCIWELVAELVYLVYICSSRHSALSLPCRRPIIKTWKTSIRGLPESKSCSTGLMNKYLTESQFPRNIINFRTGAKHTQYQVAGTGSTIFQSGVDNAQTRADVAHTSTAKETLLVQRKDAHRRRLRYITIWLTLIVRPAAAQALTQRVLRNQQNVTTSTPYALSASKHFA